MRQKEININEKLYYDILTYCNYNNINTEKYIEQALKTRLMLDKYGTSPFDNTQTERQQETRQEETITENTNETKPKRIRKPKTETKNEIKQPEQEKETKKIISKRTLK